MVKSSAQQSKYIFGKSSGDQQMQTAKYEVNKF